ncbi:MFS transporter [Saccharopolyspora griseoalba]|uniref:MFS transporter n=1 Tax=Saccharopolyspora griseoalba TaxID=1431848 RepID=A0ABW2LNL3_9PSEU
MASSSIEQPAAAPSSDVANGPGRGAVLLLAAAVGLCVANNYYAQPLLATIAADLRLSATTAALVVTAAQIGYGLGLVFLLPLGDLLERRRLVCGLTAATALSLALTAVAPNGGLLLLGTALTGLLSVAAQVLVPFAADLAAPHQRGKIVGTVMSGLVLGMLLARTASGALAELGGWRTAYWAAALAMLALAVALHRRLPRYRGSAAMGYFALLGSTARLFAEEPVLRTRSAIGFFAFACFGALWSSLAFLLSDPGHGWSDAQIGLLGLVGAAGAVAAHLAGRLADLGWAGRTTLIGGALLLASWGPLLWGAHDLALLLAGIVLLDLAHQGVHITNQSLIYAVRPEARGRITSAYMTCYFAGGALGSTLVGLIYPQHGWRGVCLLGAALALALCLVGAGGAGAGGRGPRPRPLPAVGAAVLLGWGWLMVVAVVLRLLL